MRTKGLGVVTLEGSCQLFLPFLTFVDNIVMTGVLILCVYVYLCVCLCFEWEILMRRLEVEIMIFSFWILAYFHLLVLRPLHAHP
jgi:hypothetical protein